MLWLKKPFLLSIAVCFIFFLAYSVLSITKYNHFDSGYDLGIAGQVLWEYSKFHSPITTIESNAFTSLLTDHVEIIYLILSPFYWVWNDPRMLLLLQAFFISFSGIPIFLLAKERRLNIYLCYSILISYLSFYGIQNAIWADVHSVVFGASFITWLIYFLETKKDKLAVIVSILAILSKENIAGITLLIAIFYLIVSKKKIGLYLAFSSLCYLLFIFTIYFPYFTSDGYR